MTDPLLSGFRYNSTLSGSTTLAVGDYVIAAQGVDGGSGEDLVMGNILAANLTMAGGITYVENRLIFTAGLAFPTTPFVPQERGYFGPNFQFNASASAPEPGTLALLALGGGLAWVKRRRK